MRDQQFWDQSNHAYDETCPKCSAGLQIINKQRYCSQCRECPTLLYEDTKFTPEGYRPNFEDIKINSLVRIQRHLQDFLKTLGIIQTQSQINCLVQRICYLHHKRGAFSKGYLEESAALIYIEYSQFHKMNIRQFCSTLNIKLKKFNKKYLFMKEAWKGRERQQGKEELKVPQDLKQESTQQIKQEEQLAISDVFPPPVTINELFLVHQDNEENQSRATSEEKQSQNKQVSNETDPVQFRQIKKSILEMYPKIFKSQYMRISKESLVDPLCNKVYTVYLQHRSLDSTLLRHISSHQKHLYYILAVIKGLQFSVSIKEYRQIVESTLGLRLNTRNLSHMIKSTQPLFQSLKQEHFVVNKDGFNNNP